MKRDDPAPPVRYCPACDRALPPDTAADDCPGCQRDRQRAAKQREWEALRARLAPAPYTRSRNMAAWSIESARELLSVAVRYAERDEEHAALLAALRHLAAAATALRRAGASGTDGRAA